MTDTDIAPSSSARPSDEMLPFLNNFHDIFTTIGVLILLGGISLGIGQVMGTLGLPEGEISWQLALMGLIAGATVLVWLLSALLVGKQRRILPGIVLAGAFMFACTILLVWGYTQILVQGLGLEEGAVEAAFEAAEGMEFGRPAVAAVTSQLPWSIRLIPVIAALAAFLPAFLYYRQFRLPFAGGLSGVGLVGLVVAIAFTIEPYTVALYLPTVSVLAGLGLLIAGIIFDARDPARETRLAGTAFWLHFFAAPILLSAVLNVTQIGWSFKGFDVDNPEAVNMFAALAANDDRAASLAMIALAVIGVFALVSLLINRRALIVSGLLTAGLSIAVLVNAAGLGAGAMVAVTLLVLGAVVVVLGAAWNPIRSVLLAPFPSEGPLARLFPPVSAREG